MITYRCFRNWDPPALVQLWNRSAIGRGAARSLEVQDLDRLIFSKPYFDPKGMVVAEQQAQPVGFAHAGFGTTGDEAGLHSDYGVITMVVVSPSHRRQGIGRELVRRAEAYLRGSGSRVIYAGGMHPLNPFYLGLYGGSEMPGILRSNPAAHDLFRSLGYEAVDECQVLQRALNGPLTLTNAKARSWSHKTRFVANSDAVASSWWSACQYASLEHVDFALCLKPSAQVIAQARGWEMYPLQKAWEAEAVGIVDLQVAPEFRRQGLGTYFLVQILKYYRDCGATLAEAQTMTRNLAARRLFARVGFQDIDSGVVYRSQASDAAPPPLRRPPLPLQPSKPPE